MKLLYTFAILITCIKLSLAQETFRSVSEDKDAVKFAVISDTHIGRWNSEKKVRSALQNIVAENTGLDAIIVVGDITDNGKESEYMLFKKVFDEEVKNIPAYFCLGNHDRYNDFGNENTLFQTVIGQDLNQYVTIKEYPFILISMENKNATGGYRDYAKNFLSEKLAHASGNFTDKPIFVFVHVPVANTVYGSFVIGGGDSWGSSDLKSICEQYPQIILFSGHSHFPLGDERSIHQDKFTSINDGNVSYVEIEAGLAGGTRPENNENVNEGCIVAVKENKDVEVKRFNFTQNTEIKSPWLIKAPHNGSAFAYKGRTGGEKPSFALPDKPIIKDITARGCYVTFRQATDDDDVQSYKIEILDKGGNIVDSFKMFSLFYLNHQTPDSLTCKIEKLKPESKYTVRITAIDSFGNQSEPPIVSDEFSTPAIIASPPQTILNIKFRPTEAIDISESKFLVTNGENKPEAKFDSQVNQYVTSYTGNKNTFYKVNYKGNSQFKNLLSTGHTLEIFAKTLSNEAVCCVGSMEAGGFGIEQATNGITCYWFGVQSGGYKKIGTQVVYDAKDPQYYHMVFTYNSDGEVVKSYYNGVAGHSLNLGSSLRLSSQENAHWIGIGGDASIYNYVQAPFVGDIALVRMYDKALSEDAVKELYQEINDRKAMEHVGLLNRLLTEIIPELAAYNPSVTTDEINAFRDEGWALMDNMNTTDNLILKFKEKIDNRIGKTAITADSINTPYLIVKDKTVYLSHDNIPFSIYSIGGQQHKIDEPLPNGIYIVKTPWGQTKVIIN